RTAPRRPRRRRVGDALLARLAHVGTRPDPPQRRRSRPSGPRSAPRPRHRGEPRLGRPAPPAPPTRPPRGSPLERPVGAGVGRAVGDASLAATLFGRPGHGEATRP